MKISVTYFEQKSSRHPQDWEEKTKSFDNLVDAMVCALFVENPEYKTFVSIPVGNQILKIEGSCFTTGEAYAS